MYSSSETGLRFSSFGPLPLEILDELAPLDLAGEMGGRGGGDAGGSGCSSGSSCSITTTPFGVIWVLRWIRR